MIKEFWYSGKNHWAISKLALYENFLFVALEKQNGIYSEICTVGCGQIISVILCWIKIFAIDTLYNVFAGIDPIQEQFYLIKNFVERYWWEIYFLRLNLIKLYILLIIRIIMPFIFYIYLAIKALNNSKTFEICTCIIQV